MIERIEKKLVRRQVFQRIAEGGPEGFPFELRLAWRASMAAVYGDRFFELAGFDNGKSRFDEAVSQRIGPIAFHVVPPLIDHTRTSLEVVLTEEGLSRPQLVVVRGARKPSASLRQASLRFDWTEPPSDEFDRKALFFIQSGVDQAFREHWYERWSNYLSGFARKAVRMSFNVLTYDDLRQSFVKTFWELSESYDLSDSYTFKARLRFALMDQVDQAYRGARPVTMSESAHHEVRREEKVGRKGVGFSAAEIPEAAETPSGDPLRSLERKETTVAVRAALRSLKPELAQRLRKHLEHPETELPEDLEEAIGGLRKQLAHLRA